jgi:DNA-binding NarL/FixJ family response regulator
MLLEDENPYVAVRAEKTIDRLRKELSKSSSSAEIEPDKINVIVAEDNSFVQSLMLRKLKESDKINIVATVSDGEAVIDAAKRFNPDVILMDYRMPKINGIEATETIKEERPEIRIVMVTGCDSDKSIVQALNAGADGYYLKTNAFNQLTTCIDVVSRGGHWLDPAISTSILRQCFIKEENSCLGDMDLDYRTEKSDTSPLNIDTLKETVKELVSSRKTDEAITLCKAVYEEVVNSFGKTSEQAIDVLTLAADLYFSKKDYANAEKYFLHILETRQDVLKRADQKTDCIINTLARMSESTGNLQQAELYYTWSLRIRERSGDPVQIDDVRNKLLSVTLAEANA